MSKGYASFISVFLKRVFVETLFIQALTRLTPQETYNRAYRFKRASQASVLHKELPKSEWINPEEVGASWTLQHKY
jgi:Ubiquinol-cytochrome C reductase complex 14kD subunit